MRKLFCPLFLVAALTVFVTACNSNDDSKTSTISAAPSPKAETVEHPRESSAKAEAAEGSVPGSAAELVRAIQEKKELVERLEKEVKAMESETDENGNTIFRPANIAKMGFATGAAASALTGLYMKMLVEDARRVLPYLDQSENPAHRALADKIRADRFEVAPRQWFSFGGVLAAALVAVQFVDMKLKKSGNTLTDYQHQRALEKLSKSKADLELLENALKEALKSQ